MHLDGKLRTGADSALTSMPVQQNSSPEAESIKTSMFSPDYLMDQILLMI